MIKGQQLIAALAGAKNPVAFASLIARDRKATAATPALAAVAPAEFNHS